MQGCGWVKGGSEWLGGLRYEEIWRKFEKGLAIFVNIWYYGDRK